MQRKDEGFASWVCDPQCPNQIFLYNNVDDNANCSFQFFSFMDIFVQERRAGFSVY
ncbi:MAG: hypothetical protein ACTSRH_08135 [Promethearchaeota archaeon]